MKKAGEIIALIAGIFAVIAAFATLMFGGIASAFNAADGQTVVGLGWGGVAFSFLVIILSAIGLGTSSKITSVLLILASIGGAILGGTLVAIFMALSFIGGILALLGTKSTSSAIGIESNAPKSKRNLIIISVVSALFLAMVVSAVVRNAKDKSTESTEVAGITDANNVAVVKVEEPTDCKSYIPNLKQTDIYITAVEKAQTFDPSVYDNVLLSQSGKSLLVPPYPGTLIQICIADIFYGDSTKKELVYTVSKLEDQSIHIMSKDNAAILPSLNGKMALDKILADEKTAKNDSDSSMHNKPSFDCTNAHGFVEQTICGDSELAKLDVEMHDAYIRIKEKVDETQLKKEQLDWMNQRNQCKDIQCIKTAYQVRNTQFAAESE